MIFVMLFQFLKGTIKAALISSAKDRIVGFNS